MVTENVITLSVPQVIDLALNSPEVGAVNFNLLHNVLHIIVQQLQIHDTIVEFRGKDGDKIKMLLTAAAGKMSSAVHLTEYAIVSDDKGNKKRTDVTEARKLSKMPDVAKNMPAEKQEVVVLVQPEIVQTPQMTVCLSEQTIIDIQNDINELKQHVEQLIDLPKNCSLMDALKHKDKPVVEMFQIMTLAKRIDAAEAGLQKLGSLVEDLTAEMQVAQFPNIDGDYDEDITQTSGNPQASPRPTSGKGKPAQEKLTQSAKGKSQPKSKSESAKPKGGEQSSAGTELRSPTQSVAQTTDAIAAKLIKTRSPPEFMTRIGNCEKRLQAIEETLQANAIPAAIIPSIKYPSKIDLSPMGTKKSSLLGGTTSSQPHDSKSLVQSPPSYPPHASSPPSADQPLAGAIKKEAKKDEDASRLLPTNDIVLALQKDVNKMKREIKKMKTIGGGRDTDDSAIIKPEKKRGRKSQGHDDGHFGDLETKVRDSAETLISMDQHFNNQILQLQNNFSVLEMDVNTIMEKLAAALPGGDSGVESIGDLFKKMQRMQIDIENIAETTAALIDDLATKKTNFESLNETVELLKTIKADKEDLEDALADKADKCAINRKVSHDQFDTACDELSRGIEEALEKLTTQELLWQQALDEIQFEISNKLDKMELGPLRDFINNKLRMLQERMKSLTALKKEQEAAGTKSKFLRNVNCISCDKDVVMRKQMDAALMPQPRALPPSRSMAPYLAYELDALRKQQKTLANSRNLNHFESAITGGKSPRMDDHVCNRYCGGSHTVTTPQQRVTRMGHFLAQWGPGAVPVTDTVPTKEEPKQERKASLTGQGDQKKISQTDVKDDGTAAGSAQKGDRKSSRGSIKSAPAAPKATPEEPKDSAPPSAGGPSGDDKKSSGSQEKAKTSIGNTTSSQKSAKRKGSKGSAKGSKQSIVQEGSKEVVADENAKDVPEQIVEETPSEVAAAESPAEEPNDMANAQAEDVVEAAEKAEEPVEEKEQVEPEAELANEE